MQEINALERERLDNSRNTISKHVDATQIYHTKKEGKKIGTFFTSQTTQA